MDIILFLFASFIFMWIVALAGLLAGLIAIILKMFLKDYFYTEDTPSHAIRITRVTQNR